MTKMKIPALVKQVLVVVGVLGWVAAESLTADLAGYVRVHR